MQANPEHRSIRLFENDFLESLTHVHPLVPLLLWSPVAGFLLWRSIAVELLPATGILGCAIAGLLLWTLTEYLLHRFAFHFPARSKPGKWLVFLFHGNHHQDPRDKTRLVMPPGGSIPIMLALYYLFSLAVPQPWLQPLFAFFFAGYLCYDYIHYGVHHFPMRNPIAAYLKRHHLKHHYSGEKARYGVSSPLWDLVFRSTGSPSG